MTGNHFLTFIRFIVILLLTSTTTFGQNLSEYNWYFGNNQRAILFNKSDNEPALDSLITPPNAIGGSAVANDPVSGDLLFYADGDNIYDMGHTLMMGDLGLSSQSTDNQPVGISPVLNSPDEYYVLYRNAGGDLEFSLVDMSLQGNGVAGSPSYGEVTATNQVTSINSINPNFIIVAPNDSTYYLISQNSANDQIQTHQILAGGIFTFLSSVPLPVVFDVENFSYSLEADQIAISSTDANTNVHIVNLDPFTGVLTYSMELFNTGNSDPTLPSIYDTEWSADASKLYISRHGDAATVGDVVQVDMITPMATPTSVLPATVDRSFGLKRGPDGRIYHLMQNFPNNIRLARINDADSAANLVMYESDPLGDFDFTGQQFPEFSPAVVPDLGLAITAFDFCLNNTTKFFPVFDVTPTSFFWDFGDNTGLSNLITPIYTYQAPGIYDVTLTTEINGRMDTATLQINIIDNNLQVNLQDTTICPGETVLLDATTEGAVSYTWNTNETTPSISVDSAGTYWVVVQHTNGCTAYGSAVVTIVGNNDQRANIWYFGQNAGIDFNEQPALPLGDSNMDAPEGCATFSDANGDLLFYTDGETVFNRLHTVMPNGNTIGGEPGAAQSTIIVPFAGDNTLYYVFTTEEIYGDLSFQLRYAVMDIKSGGGFGDITIKSDLNDTIFLFENTTERLTANNQWLIAHEYGNNTFRAYPITPGGIAPPVLSTIGAPHSFSIAENGQGYMKLSADGSRLAVALRDAGGNNAVELFNFVDSLGEITDYIRLDLGTEMPYGIEFSPGTNKLLVSVNEGALSRILEYRIDSVDQDFTNNSRLVLPLSETSAIYGALQTGPDGQIYVAVDGSPNLSTITPNDDTLVTSAYNDLSFALAGGTTSRLGLPNFIQNISSPPASPTMITFNGCTNDLLQFSAIQAYQNDAFLWDFGDGTSLSTDQNPSHAYTAQGDYTVTLIVTRCLGNPLLDDNLESDTLTQVVTISDFPVDPQLPNAAILCDDPPLILNGDNGQAGVTYEWELNGTIVANTPDITITQGGRYIFRILNGSGCNFVDSVDVFPALQLDLGPDLTICQNDILTLDTDIPGALSYDWRRDGAPVGSAQTQLVDASSGGVFSYSVSVEDPVSPGCFVQDTVVITINEVPTSTITPTNPTCGLNNGQLDIVVTSVGNFTINWFDVTNTLVGTGNTISNIPAGSYRADVSNVTSGCFESFPAVLSSVGLSVSNFNGTACSTDLSTINIGLGGFTFPVNYILTDNGTGSIITTGSNQPDAGGSTIDINSVPTGSFSVQVTEAGGAGCTASNANINITPLDSVDFSINPQPCLDPGGNLILEAITVNPTSDHGFLWSSVDGTIIGGGNSQTLTVGSTGTYTATVSRFDATECPAVQSFTVNSLIPNPVPLIDTAGIGCQGSIQLIAAITPTGNYTVEWERDGVITGDLGLFLTLDDPLLSGSYRARVTNQQTGCQQFSPSLDVAIFDPVQVVANADFACDDGQAVALRATSSVADVSFAWFDGLGTPIPNSDSSVIFVQDQGIYTVRVTTVDGCTSTEFAQLVRAPLEDSNVMPPFAEICSLDPDITISSVELDADPDGDFLTYEWSLNGTILSNDQIFVATQPGSYRVALSSNFGCIRVDSVLITDNCIPLVRAPKAFSPNNNGVNDEFFIFPKFISEEGFEVIIYNRWGEAIFRSQNRDFRWNGNHNGQPVPVGTYAWVIKFRDEFGNDGFEERDGVTVIR